MSGFTPNFQIEFLEPGQPIRDTRAVLERMAKSVDAALTRGGVAPPNAQDLVAVAGRVTALETAKTPGKRVGKAGTNNAVNGWGQLQWDQHDTADGWTNIPPAGGDAGTGMFTSATPTRLIAPRAGRYRASLAVTFGPGTLGDRRVMVRRNSGGSPTAGNVLAAGLGSNAAAVPIAVATDEFHMDAGDHIEAYGLSTTNVVMGTVSGYEASFALSFIGP